MERRVLLFGFVQYLWLFVYANSSLNETLMNNCIGIDMAKIEEYTRTLPTPKSFTNSTLITDENQEKVLPFGGLKSDWARLHLLHDALPEESDLKKGFKHLYRLLLSAYEEATRVRIATLEDPAEVETTEAVLTKEENNIQGVDKKPITEHETILSSTGQSHKAEVTLKELHITVSPVDSQNETDAASSSSMSNLITISPNSGQDGVDSVVTNNIDEVTKPDNEESTIVRANIPDLEALFESSTILNLGNSCVNCTDEDSVEVLVNTTVSAVTGEREESLIFIDTTTVSGEEIILKSSQKDLANVASSNHSLSALTISPSENNFIGKLMNSTEQEEKQDAEVIEIEPVISLSTTILSGETFLNVTEAANFTPTERNFNSTKSFNTLFYGPSNKTLPEQGTLNIDEDSLAASICNKQSSKNLLSSTTSKEDLLILPNKEENISLPESPVTTIVMEQYSTHEDNSSATTVSSYKITDNQFSISHDDDSLATRNSEYFTSTQKEDELSASTKNETRSVEFTTVTNLVKTFEKTESPLWTINATSETKEEKESTLNETQSENPLELNLPSSESIGSTVVKSTTPSSFVEFHSEKNVKFTTDSTDDASFGAVQNNNELTLTTLSRGIEFVTTEKSNERKDVLSSTSSPTLTFTSSSIPTVTESYTDQRLKTMIGAKESNIPKDKQQSNEANSSKDGSSTERIPMNLNVQSTGRTTEKNEDISKVTVLNIAQSTTEEYEVAKFDDKTIFLQVPNITENQKETNKEIEKPTIKSNGIKNPSQIKNNTENQTEINEEVEKTTIKSYDIKNPSQIRNNIRNGTETNEEIKRPIKPFYIKNPLVTGSPRSNQISRDFKHESGKAEASKNLASQQIILYESGGGAKIANEWRPHVVRERPVGNNIWRFDGFPANSKPYVYQRSRPSTASKRKDLINSKISAKFPSADTMNSLRSRKRNSANADIRKQLSGFYRQLENDNSNKSRSNENRNTNITIRCKSAQ